MTAYAFDGAGWYAGEVPDDTPGSTTIAPPEHLEERTPGEPWPQWRRFMWVMEVFEPPAPVVVPASVTRRQARRALHAASLLDAVEEAINDLPEPERTAVRIDWDDAATYERADPTLQRLASLLDLTGEQLDQLFITAGGL